MKLRFPSFLIVLCTILALLLSSCGTNSDNAPDKEVDASTTTSSDAEEVTEKTETPVEKDVDLRVITSRVEDKEFYDKFNELFQKEYPHIHVKFDAIPTKDYDQVATTRIASGEVDTMSHAAQFNDPQKREALLFDLKGQPFLQNYFPDALKQGEFDGKQYFLPLNSTSIVTFYNKKIFNDLNISIPKTWQEFINVCEEIKASGIDPLVFGGKDQWPVNMVVLGLEGGIVSAKYPNFYQELRDGKTKFTDPAWLEVFTKLNTLNKYFIKNTLGLAYAQTPGIFAQGKAAMMIDGSWSATDILKANPDFEVGAFITPGSDDGEYNKYIPARYGVAWTILKDSPNIEAALKYVDFMSRPDIYQMYTDMVKMLPLQPNIKMNDPLQQEIASLMTNQVNFWENLLLDLIPGVKFDYTPNCIDMLSGNITPQEAAEKLQASFEASKPNWK